MRFLDEDIRMAVKPDLSHIKRVILFTVWEDTWINIYMRVIESQIMFMIL